MVLPGYALMAEGTQIHIAVWPLAYSLDPARGAGPLLSHAFAAQGSCYLVALCALLSPDDVPEAFRDQAGQYISTWVKEYPDNKGASCIIGPGGNDIGAVERQPTDSDLAPRLYLPLLVR